MQKGHCYSPTEDVLKNPTAIKLLGVTVGETTGGIWAKQELFKGCTLWYGLNSVTFAGTRIEGGWGINADYVANPLAYFPLIGFNPAYFENHTRGDLIINPLFTSFNDERMSATNELNIVDYELRAKMLGDAIPAESFAAGANPATGISANFNFQGQNTTPNGWPRATNVWRHSDLKDVAYFYVWKLFEKIRRRE